MNERLFRAIAEVKNSISMRELCERYGLRFNRGGFCGCPFHNEKTPSFYIHNGKGHCFGCGWHGDVIDFVQKYDGYSNKIDAVRYIGEMFGLNLYLDEPPTLSQYRATSLKLKQAQIDRQQESNTEDKLKQQYDDALIGYILCDRWQREYAPASADEEINLQYAYAVKHIDYYKYLLAEAEVNEWKFKSSQLN